MSNPPDPLRWGATFPERGWALVRFATYATAFVGLYVGGFKLLAATTGVHMSDAPGTPVSDLLLVQATFLACVVIANLLGMIVWRRPIAEVGLQPRAVQRDLALGLLTGASLMALLLVILIGLGVLKISGIVLLPDQILSYGAAYVLMFAMAAVAEQGLMRAFALTQLSRAISFWPSALLMATLFGLMHLGNGAESGFGAVVAAVFGLASAYAFKRSGALWFALGFHAAWDFVEAWVFGVPSSGRVATGALTHGTLTGPVALTGGSAGPEGSYLALVAMALLFVVIHYAVKPPLATSDH